MSKKIVITGATGLIGSQLVEQLKPLYDLIILTRNPNKREANNSVSIIRWDGVMPIPAIVDGSYAIINLIGENIGSKRWTDRQKKLILDSRKLAAEAIAKSIELCDRKPEVWIQGSATGFYGQATGKADDESSPLAKGAFLATVCEEWERPITGLKCEETRKIIIRTGVVFAQNSDLWKQLNASFAFGIAAIVGSGKQILPWIHIEDEVRAILFLLQNKSSSGCYNLVAPHKTSMADVVAAIQSKKRSFLTLRVPRWFLRLVFGKEKADELILTDQYVVPKRLLQEGFDFKYPTIADTVKSFR